MQSIVDFLTRLTLAGAAVLFATWIVLRCRGCFARAADTLAKASRSRIAAFLVFVAIATVCAQKPGGTNEPPRDASSPHVVQPARSSENGVCEVTNLCFTGISVSSNSVMLSLAWPTNFLADGACLDFFAKVGSLTNRWEWICSDDVLPGATNLVATIPCGILPSATNLPTAAFFRVVDRATDAATMRDWDGDGVPDVYEIHNGTNPYVQDAALAPRLAVGDNGDYSDLASALAASTDYSIISLSAGEVRLPEWVVMPGHPVMVSGPEGGYAVLRSAAGIAAVVLDGGQTEETLFRNLILVLEHEGGFQAGFWIGGNLPWSGVGASPTFENVRVRATRPGTLYYGWHYYRDNGGTSLLTNCVMNASGADVACGVYSNGGPAVEMHGCAFLNFPTNGGSYATYFHGVTNTVAWNVPSEHGLSWAGYPLAMQYSATADSDGDGITDFDEIFTCDTDPWLADSDGDGVRDGDEMDDGTDPRVFGSFLRHVTVVATADDSLSDVTNYVAWGVAEHGWETNDVAAFASSPGTNEFTVANSNTTVYAKAYRDMNLNGEYDEGVDILLVKTIPENSESTIRFAFGDVDGDGVSDVQERAEGTDHYDSANFRLSLTLVFENSDASVAATNYCECGPEAAWVGGGAIAFAQTASITVDTVVTNGVAYAKCLRDFNGDGVYADGDDVLYVRTLTRADNGKTVAITVGDRDADGIPDGEEVAEGTDPHDSRSYCFNLALVENGVVRTTNDLSVVVKLGDAAVYGPAFATNRTFEADVGHVVVTNGGVVTVYFWDDANTNGVRDAEEPCVTRRLLPNGHENVVTNTFQAYVFDRDSDGMLDWWEALHSAAGLSPTNSADAWLDPDGDGLINLHEYWADCDPLTPDGSNTALSVMARSVDGRTRNCTPTMSKHKFVNYAINGQSRMFITNSNFWAGDIDTSCASMWNSYSGKYRAGTLISKRHMLFANHYLPSPNCIVWFLGDDGVTYSNKVTTFSRITNTDISIALLEDETPAAVSPAKILPPNYGEYISSGVGLPVLEFDMNENGFVYDIGRALATKTHYSENNGAVSYYEKSVVLMRPFQSERRGFYKSVDVGDSGNPGFLLLGTTAVLVGIAHARAESGFPGDYILYQPFATIYVDEIQSTMDALCPGYSLEYVDLSVYNRLSINAGGEQ